MPYQIQIIQLRNHDYNDLISLLQSLTLDYIHFLSKKIKKLNTPAYFCHKFIGKNTIISKLQCKLGETT